MTPRTRTSRRKSPPTRVAPKARKTATKKRGPVRRKPKVHATFDLYRAAQRPGIQRIIRALQRLVRRVAPKLEESIKWSGGCWMKEGIAVAYIDATPAYVQFGFLRGVELRDPRGLLAGRGKHVRHITLFRVADIDEKALAALLRQAMALGRAAR